MPNTIVTASAALSFAPRHVNANDPGYIPPRPFSPWGTKLLKPYLWRSVMFFLMISTTMPFALNVAALPLCVSCSRDRVVTLSSSIWPSLRSDGIEQVLELGDDNETPRRTPLASQPIEGGRGRIAADGPPGWRFAGFPLFLLVDYLSS